MAIEVRAATAADVAEFASWQYEAPYNAYDMTDERDEAVEYFLDPSMSCHVLVDSGDLVGFCTFGPDGQVSGGRYERDAVDLGMGIRPELTGKGRGRLYTEAAIAQARQLFPDKALRVTIAEWNRRAVRVCVNAGFTEASRFVAPDDTTGTRKFVVLELG